jgi:hypothetical protein
MGIIDVFQQTNIIGFVKNAHGLRNLEFFYQEWIYTSLILVYNLGN